MLDGSGWGPSLWAKRWILEGTVAAIVALIVTYVVLEPAPTLYGYASILGWGGMVGALLILVQGFRTIETQSFSHSGSGVARYEFAITRWGGIHTALAIAVTVLIAIHGVLFLGGLLEFSVPIWIGAAAFTVLVISNLSGAITESKRRSRAFGSLKTMHMLLVLAVIVLSAIHIEVMLGPSYARTFLGGAIVALIVVSVVFVTLPLTLRTEQPL